MAVNLTWIPPAMESSSFCAGKGERRSSGRLTVPAPAGAEASAAVSAARTSDSKGPAGGQNKDSHRVDRALRDS